VITDPGAVAFVLATIVALAVWLEPRAAPFRAMGAALITILCGMTLSNAGILPAASTAYDFIAGPAVNAGIVLILLSVDVRTVVQAGPHMLAAFGIGAVGSAVGSGVAAVLLADHIGADSWKLAGQYAATYTGGGVNFAAVGAALDTRGELFAAGLAADVMVTAAWMATCLIVPLLFAGPAPPPPGTPVAGAAAVGPPRIDPDKADQAGLAERLSASRGPLRLGDVSVLVALVLGALVASDLLATWTAPVPRVLWLTTIALVIAQVPGLRTIRGSAMMGNYLILLFLSTTGARSVVARILAVGPPVVVFALLTVAIHGAVIFGVGRLFGLDLPTLAVASQANIGGPSSAIALSSARGYQNQLLPGVAAGLLGYAAGNYVGFAVAAVMRGILGA